MIEKIVKQADGMMDNDTDETIELQVDELERDFEKWQEFRTERIVVKSSDGLVKTIEAYNFRSTKFHHPVELSQTLTEFTTMAMILGYSFPISMSIPVHKPEFLTFKDSWENFHVLVFIERSERSRQ